MSRIRSQGSGGNRRRKKPLKPKGLLAPFVSTEESPSFGGNRTVDKFAL